MKVPVNRSLWVHRPLIPVFLAIALLWAAQLPAAQAPRAESAGGLLGNWECRNESGVSYLEFQKGNRLVYEGEAARYTQGLGVLRVEEDGELVNYQYSLKGDVLEIVFPEGDRMNCRRVAAAGGQASGRAPSRGGGATSPGDHLPQGMYADGTPPPGPNDPALMRQFSGTYWGYSGSTEMTMSFCANGTFTENTESSYSGRGTDSLGNPNMAWGTAGSRGAHGVWAITGNMSQGTITIRWPTGTVRSVPYHAVDRGCYQLMKDTLCRKGPPQCP
jgi:hypothetical protein